MGRENVLAEYYTRVYRDLDMSALIKYSTDCSDTEDHMNTGYSGSSSVQKTRIALQSLHSISKLGIPIVIASNSPAFHVHRVLYRLGLAELPLAAIITPERNGGTMKNEAAFWTPLLEMFPIDQFVCSLVDDNALNIALVSSLGIVPYRIIEGSYGLDMCLQAFLLNEEDSDLGDALNCPAMSFRPSDMDYLTHKNAVDSASLNRPVQRELVALLKDRVLDLVSQSGGGQAVLGVVDLGSGLLSLLPELGPLLREACHSLDNVTIRYTAYEANPLLQEPICERLRALGFSYNEHSDGWEGRHCELSFSVHLRQQDFMTCSLHPDSGEAVQLVVAGCVADLLHPARLAARLLEWGEQGRAGVGSRLGLGCVVYLPITCGGQNRFLGGKPSGSDERVWAAVLASYSSSLRARGHHFHTGELRAALRAHGFRLSALSEQDSLCSSPWLISRGRHSHMWRCMTRFLLEADAFLDPSVLETARVSGVASLANWFSLWLLPVEEGGPEEVQWRVANVDLLAELPPQLVRSRAITVSSPPSSAVAEERLGVLRTHFSSSDSPHKNGKEPAAVEEELQGESVEFLGGGKLRLVKEALPSQQDLRAGQLLLRSHCCLVSPGTELKAFSGQLVEDLQRDQQQLDLTLSSLKSALPSYPMRYGYSFAGTVIAEALQEGETASMLGKRVFAFLPHGSHGVAMKEEVLEIPDDISFEDAVFLPSVETAVSLVMSAAPLVGEAVCVVGQGLIGYLTAAVLQLSLFSDPRGSPAITIADVNEKRLRLTSELLSTEGAVRSWNPSKEDGDGVQADVSIEVSGSLFGLQTALDCTRPGGSIVLGSWYNSPSHSTNPLRLGARFHRSNFKLVTSQVSKIPGHLTDRWDKNRRFQLVWGMIRRIRPSRVFSGMDNGEIGGGVKVSMRNESDIGDVYKSLSRGDVLTALLCNHYF